MLIARLYRACARCAGRAVALRVEPLSKAQRLAPSGGHPSRGLAATLRARWRAGCRRTAARGAWPVRSPMQRSRLRLHRDPEHPGQTGVAGCPSTAAGSRARGSATRHARCRAAECDELIGPARPPRQALTFGSLGGTSAAEAPYLMCWEGAFAATAAPGSRHIGRAAASPEHGAARAPVVPPRSPQLRPRRITRGTHWCACTARVPHGRGDEP